jgi:peptidoglycan/xylan/chitin deacetylase (PgdA/CDA1 family)
VNVRLALARLVGVPAGVAIERVMRLTARRIGFALLYHHVDVQPGDPRREIVPALGLRLFAAQLHHLRSHYRVVPASQLHAAVLERRRGERFPVALTFDDDHEGHAHLTLAALREAGATATFFITGSSLDGPASFWWEDLQALYGRPAWKATDVLADGGDDIHELSERVQLLPPQQRAAVVERLRSLAGPPAAHRGMRRADVSALVESGCELGFHTLLHEPLTTLDDSGLAAALRDGRAELEELAGASLATIAYPHGKVDARVASAARAAGFTYGFTVETVAVGPESDPLLLGRLHPSFSSVGHFALQLARRLLPSRRIL